MEEGGLLQMWREIEDEHMVRQIQEKSDEVLVQQRSDGLVVDASQEDAGLGENESETWSQSQSQNGSQYKQDQEELNSSNRENSAEIEEVGRERVRKIFRGWMSNGGCRIVHQILVEGIVVRGVNCLGELTRKELVS
jgi:hypothetical protein